MPITVPWVSNRTIEAEADILLQHYAKECEPILRPPVPIDEIPETLLKVSLDFDDLGKLLGRPNVIGATWFDRREIFIDQSLDPTEHPEKCGRYRFTVGHEIGHWILHRRHVPDRANQIHLFGEQEREPSVICRDGDSVPAEVQANRFASCLLMPRAFVLAAWREQDSDSAWIFDAPKYQAAVTNGFTDSYDVVAKMIMNNIASNFAPLFHVSVEAMRIRLENLGLLKKVQGGQLLNLEKAG